MRRSLVKAVGHDVPIQKNVDLDLVHILADKVLKAQRGLDGTTWQIFEKEGMIMELELKFRLFADDSVAVVYLRG